MVACAVAFVLGPGAATAAEIPPHPMPARPHGSTPLYREGTFHVLLGLGLAAAATIVFGRVRTRRRLVPAPAGYAAEGILAVDLVDSTRLAVHYGEPLAMWARTAIRDRARAAADRHGLSFFESTGDGCLMTFPSAAGAVRAAIDLLRDLDREPPDLAPGLPLSVRAGVSYGEILIDGDGARHGAAINRAFRLEALAPDAFVRVRGEVAEPGAIPTRDRILIDEEAAQELEGHEIARRSLGYCRLKGFSGLHRVWEVSWRPGQRVGNGVIGTRPAAARPRRLRRSA